MRLILTGGGTAGHIYPLLSVLEELRKKLKNERIDVLYIGSKGGIEEEILKNKQVPCFFVYSGKWRRYWLKWPPALLQNIRDLFLILIGFFEAFLIVLRYRPEIVLAKGGYVTLPVIFASWFCHIPLITHESDTVMGISNRISAQFARRICVSFPLEFYRSLPEDKIVFTGNPVRKEFYSARISLSRKHKPLILVTGGSRGSEKINHTVYQSLPHLLKVAEVYHLIGSVGFEEGKRVKAALPKNLQKRYFLADFSQDMASLMKKADLIISRSGANTLAEIAVLGKPSILIPLKNAAADHQTKNAQIFEKRGAAVVLGEDNLSGEKLFRTIEKLILDQESLEEMGKRVLGLGQPKAAQKIVQEIIELKP